MFPAGWGPWAAPQAPQLLGKEQVLGTNIALSWACSEAVTSAMLSSSSQSPITQSWGAFSSLTALVQDTEWAPQGLWLSDILLGCLEVGKKGCWLSIYPALQSEGGLKLKIFLFVKLLQSELSP